MAYLFQFDANYRSEEDSDYVPSDTETSSYVSDSTLSEFGSDNESDRDIKEINLDDETPTHIRIPGGRHMLQKYQDKSPQIKKRKTVSQ